MSRRLISAALGLALAASTSFGASAATTPTALVSALTGQPGVSQALINAANAVAVGCAPNPAVPSSNGAACMAALQDLVGAVPAGLSPTLTAEVTELVSSTIAARPDIAADPALTPQLASLGEAVTRLGGGPLTGATGAPAGTLPDSGAGAGAGGGGTPINNDNPASPGAAG
jgi:hypothetical protein